MYVQIDLVFYLMQRQINKQVSLIFCDYYGTFPIMHLYHMFIFAILGSRFLCWPSIEHNFEQPFNLTHHNKSLLF